MYDENGELMTLPCSYEEFVKALRYCISDYYVTRGCRKCPLNKDGMICGTQDDAIKYAADAIERLQADLAKKDSQLTEWKNAWRIANSLYKSAQAEIDELRANQHELVERIERLKAELSELKQTEQNEPKGDN